MLLWVVRQFRYSLLLTMHVPLTVDAKNAYLQTPNESSSSVQIASRYLGMYRYKRRNATRGIEQQLNSQNKAGLYAPAFAGDGIPINSSSSSVVRVLRRRLPEPAPPRVRFRLWLSLRSCSAARASSSAMASFCDKVTRPRLGRSCS